MFSSPADAMNIYRWKHRPLLVFAPDGTDPDLQRQRAILDGDTAGLRDRDMVVNYVVGNTIEARLGPAPGLDAAELRRRFGVPQDEFRAILVGKDGGSKLVGREPLTVSRLFSTIDAMPMRRDEMRSGS